jgi:methyl-accepting chemotaxis protein
MRSLINLKISLKLGLAFSICIILSAVLGIFSLQRMTSLNLITENIVNKSYGPIMTFSQFRFQIRQLRIDEYRGVVAHSPQEVASAVADQAADIAKGQKAISDYEATAIDPEDKQNLSVLQNDWANYQSMQLQLQSLIQASNDKAASNLMSGPMLTSFNSIVQDDIVIVAWDQKQVDSAVNNAKSEFESARDTTTGLLLLLFVVGILSSTTITRYMAGSLREVSERFITLNSICISSLKDGIGALEHGDLTAKLSDGPGQLKIKSADEFGELAAVCNDLVGQTESAVQSFRNTQSTLSGLVVNIQSSAKLVSTTSDALSSTTQEIEASTEQIRESMVEVSSASEQSARGAGEVAQGSATQASSISEGAELVKQLASAVHEVAREAKSAESATADVAEAADAGAKSVSETIEGIHAIAKSIMESSNVIKTLSDSSKQIGTIVQTIEDIADQTNLLALNAAIEAARAGDAGRGFAVVADEVRKLAERSRTATQEIGELIRTVQSQTSGAVSAMEGGVREANANTETAERAGKALSQIQSVVIAAASQVKAISESAAKMTESSDNVARSIADVAAIIEQSCASAEEMSASAEEVAASVQTVTETTKQQKAGLLELASSSEQLSEISQSLMNDVSQFTVLDNAQSHAGAKDGTQAKLRILRAA